MEIEGKIILELPLQEGTSKAGNHWQKKEWVLETINTNFPQKVKFHVFGDRATQLNFEVGKNYACSFDLQSREFNGRWYTDVSVYSMRELNGAQPGGEVPPVDPAPNFGGLPPISGMTQASQMGAPATPDFGSDPSDDLPF